jgi:uncharacterized Fe-S cluster-containing radical SAM superfamily protein
MAEAVTDHLTLYRVMDARDIIFQSVRTDATEFPPARIAARLLEHADRTGGEMADFNVVRLFPTLGYEKQAEVCERLEQRGFVLDGARVQGFKRR